MPKENFFDSQELRDKSRVDVENIGDEKTSLVPQSEKAVVLLRMKKTHLEQNIVLLQKEIAALNEEIADAESFVKKQTIEN